MTRNYLILILTLIHFSVSGQTKIETLRTFPGLPSYIPAQTYEIDSINMLPNFIQQHVRSILDSTMTDFTDLISFEKGQIIDLESYFEKQSSVDFTYSDSRVIPKYQLFFTLRDSTLICCGYTFEMSFDQYGQLLNLGWPREGYNHRNDFSTIKEATNMALNTAKSEKIKTKEYKIDFGFDYLTNRIYWEFAFIQKTEVTLSSYYEKLKAIRIDPITLEVIDISNMESSSVSCGRQD